MWILVPAKSASLAKSRLAPVLQDEARAVLARLLLARLLTVVTALDGVAGLLVVSADPGLRAIARLFGYEALPDPRPDLNAALEAGRQVALARGATSLLVLPTDLPRLTLASLQDLLATRPADRSAVILATDRAGRGSNALLLRPADAIPFRFGPGSAHQHRALAQGAGLPFIELRDPALAFDLDLPGDWEALVA